VLAGGEGGERWVSGMGRRKSSSGSCSQVRYWSSPHCMQAYVCSTESFAVHHEWIPRLWCWAGRHPPRDHVLVCGTPVDSAQPSSLPRFWAAGRGDAAGVMTSLPKAWLATVSVPPADVRRTRSL
jgi:hypothetical protein